MLTNRGGRLGVTTYQGFCVLVVMWSLESMCVLNFIELKIQRDINFTVY